MPVLYIEERSAMARLTKSWKGPVGRYVIRQTREVKYFSHAYAPKPGGPGHGRTKINFATGELAKGIKSDKAFVNGELEGRVIAVPKHAIYVHQGTAPHVIRARRAPFLVFFWHRVGHVVAFKKVNHPGTIADPFMVKALKRAFRRAR